jgi:hypothetical protein
MIYAPYVTDVTNWDTLYQKKCQMPHFATVFRPCVAVMWLTLLLRIGRSQVQISAWRPAILTEDFRGFPVSLQVNAGAVP